MKLMGIVEVACRTDGLAGRAQNAIHERGARPRALLVALRVRVSRLAVCPVNPPVLQATLPPPPARDGSQTNSIPQSSRIF